MGRPPKDRAIVARALAIVRAGKSPAEARDILATEGVKVGTRTIYRALDGEGKGRKPHAKPGSLKHVSDDALARALQLVDAGKTPAEAARILGGKPSVTKIRSTLAEMARIVALATRPRGSLICKRCRMPFTAARRCQVTCSKACSKAHVAARKLRQATRRYYAKRDEILTELAARRGGSRLPVDRLRKAPKRPVMVGARR